MNSRFFSAFGLAMVCGLCSLAGAQPADTSFTFQGKVTNGAAPANGTYDVQFKLFDAATAGTQLGSTNCYDSVTVTDGLITESLNFGNVFSAGATRWLEVSVRADTTPGNCSTGTYTTLSPRQRVTGAPTSIGLVLPFSGALSSSSDLLTLANAGTGAAISASATDYPANAINGFASGGLGAGVYGQNTSTGCYGTLGSAAFGVHGFNPTAYGVDGETNGDGFAGVVGFNHATTGPAKGGYFSSNGGIGVHGESNSTSGGTGVWGTATSDDGVGVYGQAYTRTGNSTGVYGRSDSVAGSGVVGLAFANSDSTSESTGETTSPQGFGGFFVGQGYFSGFVGLGTDTPSVPLQVVGGSDLTLADGGNIVIGQTGASNLVMDNNEIQARANGGAASLYINANGGNVGIGTGNAQGFQLAVAGSAAKPGGGSWSTLSDARLKKNVRPLTGSLDRLLALRGVTFEYIDPACINELSGVRTGMIAQDVEKVFPDWVDQGPDGMRRVTFRGFEALTVEALRDLRTETSVAEKATQARVDALEQENRRLHQELADLRAAVDALNAQRTAAK